MYFIHFIIEYFFFFYFQHFILYLFYFSLLPIIHQIFKIQKTQIVNNKLSKKNCELEVLKQSVKKKTKCENEC